MIFRKKKLSRKGKVNCSSLTQETESGTTSVPLRWQPPLLSMLQGRPGNTTHLHNTCWTTSNHKMTLWVTDSLAELQIILMDYYLNGLYHVICRGGPLASAPEVSGMACTQIIVFAHFKCVNVQKLMPNRKQINEKAEKKAIWGLISYNYIYSTYKNISKLTTGEMCRSPYRNMYKHSNGTRQCCGLKQP